MTTVNTAAAAAAEKLPPLIQAATQAAQVKHADALARLENDSKKAGLIAALDAVEDTPDAAVVQQFAAMLPQQNIHDLNYLPRMLLVIRRQNYLSDEQATVIARALLALVRGKLPAGLMQVDEDWHSALSVADLEQWAEWLHPEALATLRQGWEVAALDVASASYELKRLAKMQEGVKLLSAQPYKAQAVVKIHNNAERPLRIMGQGFEPGAVTTLERGKLAELLALVPMRQAIESGSLEVLR